MTLLPVILPEGSVAKVSLGDKVKAGDIIAENKGQSEVEVIHLTKDYGFAREKLKSIFKKNLGDAVSKGEKIASESGVLGVGEKSVLSKISGTVVKIDEDLGDITIQSTNFTDSKPVLSPVDGTIESCDNQKIVIKTDKPVIIAKDAVGNLAEGELLHIPESEIDRMTSDISGKVILFKSVDKLSLFKAIGLDATGIISEQFDNIDFIDLSDKKIKASVMQVEEEDYAKLEKSKGKIAYLDPDNKTIMVL